MKIAIVWEGDIPLKSMTVRTDLYAAGFKSLGHDPFVICRAGMEKDFPYPTVTLDHPEQLADPAFWKAHPADRTLMITYNRMVKYLQAAERGGHTVVALADMDGQNSARLFFRSRLGREWVETPADEEPRYRLLWRYIKLYLFNWRKEDRIFLESTELSKRVVFASEGSRREFERCLALHGRNDLIPRLKAVHYPIDPIFSQLDLSRNRARRAVAIGRWEHPQKNGRLLAQALEKYYREGGDWEICLIGSGGEGVFSDLVRAHPLVKYLGRMGPPAIAELLGTSRVLLCSSRFESGPIVAFEALSAGCTLVTTPLPTLTVLHQSMPRGIAAGAHTVDAFLAAMRAEFSAWDSNQRSTTVDAAQWQERLSPKQVSLACIEGVA